MDTPIVKFVEDYKNSGIARFHMPGHKGVSLFGPEPWDITEISGADDLGCPEGIILESEKNAAELFGTSRTLYSTGGSTQSIHAMLYLAFLRAKGNRPYILAGRNAHKAFIHAAAKLDVTVKWLYPEENSGICGCIITPEALEQALGEEAEKPFAVYVTSPDYLGQVADIPGLSRVCRAWDIPLLVDNAHGAYLAFTEPDLHPIHLGADLCCDSAHKTLPCLTGTGYLHIARPDRWNFAPHGIRAMNLFGSTSPSYLLLQSLDLCNRYLSEQIRTDLANLHRRLEPVRQVLYSKGIPNLSREPGKLTLDLRGFFRGGEAGAAHFRSQGLEPEYADGDFLVLMVSPWNGTGDLEKLSEAIASLNLVPIVKPETPGLPRGRMRMTIRQAMFAPAEKISTEDALGRICGAPTVACPPAIPIAVSGEEITRAHMELFRHYGIQEMWVVQDEINQ